MSSRLINVRLDEDRVRKARALRDSGIAVSDLLREAIDERYAKVIASRRPRDIKAILQKLDEMYPIDEGALPPRRYSVHNRKQAASAMRKHLKQKRPKAA